MLQTPIFDKLMSDYTNQGSQIHFTHDTTKRMNEWFDTKVRADSPFDGAYLKRMEPIEYPSYDEIVNAIHDMKDECERNDGIFRPLIGEHDVETERVEYYDEDQDDGVMVKPWSIVQSLQERANSQE